jgi:hypothetical protein
LSLLLNLELLRLVEARKLLLHPNLASQSIGNAFAVKHSVSLSRLPPYLLCRINHILVFCPNDKVHPARKLRIEKVIEHGGQWLTEWSTEVNYIVVEKTLCYNDLMKWLKLETMPASHLDIDKALADITVRTISLSWARNS